VTSVYLNTLRPEKGNRRLLSRYF